MHLISFAIILSSSAYALKLYSTASKGESAERTASQSWRLFNLEIPLSDDPGKDHSEVFDALKQAVSNRLGLSGKKSEVDSSNISIVRKSFDGRWKKDGQPKFVDVKLHDSSLSSGKKKGISSPLIIPHREKEMKQQTDCYKSFAIDRQKPTVVVIGSGPAGLFASKCLAENGYNPLILERGEQVSFRGRDIGALFVRRKLNTESNLCFGEGGAGTWSDGKLTTRIGKNSGEVRSVLEAMVSYGAPSRILTDGKPHLGTDRLVKILKNMRLHLQTMGATYRFNTCVRNLVIKNGKVTAVQLTNGDIIAADIVVLGIGHSARHMYESLLVSGVHLEPKGFAAGFRVEHPQSFIDSAQYGPFADKVLRGSGPVPVADYKLVASNVGQRRDKNVYSFCMCPGGQIVPTSVNPDEVCVNGMSFSKRNSKWANSALVVGLNPEDMIALGGDGPLRGVYWQQEMERRAAHAGGGNLKVPVQTVSDFMDGKPSDPFSIPSSSYRLGVTATSLNELFPLEMAQAIRDALLRFEMTIPGFISHQGLLHGVETRTSSPVRITRDPITLQSVNVEGLYPAGEGAGYAGGIISAAVDGWRVARAIIDAFSSGTSSSHGQKDSIMELG